MNESGPDKAARFDAEALHLHRRSRLARTLRGSIILRFRALWKDEAARLLRQRNPWAARPPAEGESWNPFPSPCIEIVRSRK